VCADCAPPGRSKPVLAKDMRMIERMLQIEPKSLALLEGFSETLMVLMHKYLSQFGEIDIKSMCYL
ncbi:MAG: hypothetical protein WCP73_09050, partial [Eubacteriales bacterium]